MLNRLLESYDIDARQWRALVVTSFTMLRRQRPAVSMNSSNAGLSGLWLGLLLYGIMGVMYATLVIGIPSAGMAAFLLLCLVTIFVSSVVLLEFGSSLVSPDDVLILGPRPVSSRTYFAARLAAIIVFVMLYAAALGGPSTVTFGMRFGFSVALAWLVAMILASLASGLLMVFGYALALRYVPSSRLRNVMGYLQMAFSFAIYGGYGIFAKKLPAVFAGASFEPWFVFLPQSWFASIVGLASDAWTTQNLLGVALALVSLVVLFIMAAGKISLTYTEAATAAVLESGSGKPGNVQRRGFTFTFLGKPEDRAVALLIARQFRYDTKFRMAVLSIVPLTLLYLYMGIQGNGSMLDPFEHAFLSRAASSSVLVYLAVILFPVVLSREISQSDSFQASWAFFAAPVQRGTLILSARRALNTLFVIPYLLVLSLLFLWFFTSPLHVLMHMVVLYLVSDVFQQVLWLASPQLPFSRPRGIGERMASVTLAMIFSPILLLGLLYLFASYLYPSIALYLMGTLALALISLLLRRMGAQRARAAGERMEFQG